MMGNVSLQTHSRINIFNASSTLAASSKVVHHVILQNLSCAAQESTLHADKTLSFFKKLRLHLLYNKMSLHF